MYVCLYVCMYVCMYVYTPNRTVLSISDRKLLTHRLGAHNMFDEIFAIDYYELDLSKPEERYVMQGVYVCMYVCVSMYLNMYVCVSMRMYIRLAIDYYELDLSKPEERYVMQGVYVFMYVCMYL